MLRWCAYCQEFQGEVPDFNDFSLTHGICETCFERYPDLGETDLAKIEKLQRIQERLYAAGRRGDIAAAEQIIADAGAGGTRPVDALMGLIAPLLYKVGTDWANSKMSVAEEHRFTSFCEGVVLLIELHLAPHINLERASLPKTAIIINAPGNTHQLASRFLRLALLARGISTLVNYPTPTLAALEALLCTAKPDFLFISIALAEQRAGIAEIMNMVRSLPVCSTRVIVGGNAVKMGVIEAIPGAEMLFDLSELDLRAAAPADDVLPLDAPVLPFQDSELH